MQLDKITLKKSELASLPPVVLDALHSITGQEDVLKATEAVRDAAIDSAAAVEAAFQVILSTIIQRHFPNVMQRREQVDLGETPMNRTVRLPYFATIDEKDLQEFE